MHFFVCAYVKNIAIERNTYTYEHVSTDFIYKLEYIFVNLGIHVNVCTYTVPAHSQ